MADPPAPAPAPVLVPPAPEPKTDPPLPELGDAGKRAIDAERDARKTAEKAARDATAELEKLKRSSMTDQERAVAEAKAEVRTEVLKGATDRLVQAEVKAAAAGKLADPALAPKLLDLDKFIDPHGEVDADGIASAIDALVKQHPYLAPGKGAGSVDAGARGTGREAKTSDAQMNDWLRASARR